MPVFEEHKTLKGCTCAPWKTLGAVDNDTGDHIAVSSACERDQGNGPWCFVKDERCEGNRWGYCAGVKVMTLQDAAVTSSPHDPSSSSSFLGSVSALGNVRTPCNCLGEGTVCERREKSAKRPFCRCAPNRVGAKCEFCADGYIGPMCLSMSSVSHISSLAVTAAAKPRFDHRHLLLILLFFFVCGGMTLGLCCSTSVQHDWRYRLPWVTDDRLPAI